MRHFIHIKRSAAPLNGLIKMSQQTVIHYSYNELDQEEPSTIIMIEKKPVELRPTRISVTLNMPKKKYELNFDSCAKSDAGLRNYCELYESGIF